MYTLNSGQAFIKINLTRSLGKETLDHISKYLEFITNSLVHKTTRDKL